MLRLTTETQLEIDASKSIPSLCDITSELLQNAIDANATQIVISIKSGTLEVSDDGDGMRKAQLDALGTRATTKTNHGRTFGFHGRALLNLMTLCRRVDVWTRPKNFMSVSCVHWLEGRRTVGCRRSSGCDGGPEPPRYDYGTTVRVSDWYYKYPVRQRGSASIESRDLAALEHVLVVHALIHPSIHLSILHDGHVVSFIEPRPKRMKMTQRFQELLFGRVPLSIVQVTQNHRSALGLFSSGSTSTRYRIVMLNRRQLHPNSMLHQFINQRLSSVNKKGYWVEIDLPQHELDLQVKGFLCEILLSGEHVTEGIRKLLGTCLDRLMTDEDGIDRVTDTKTGIETAPSSRSVAPLTSSRSKHPTRYSLAPKSRMISSASSSSTIKRPSAVLKVGSKCSTSTSELGEEERCDHPVNPSTSSWIQHAFSQWTNPVFPSAPTSIPKLHLPSSTANGSSTAPLLPCGTSMMACGEDLSLTKQDLHHLTFLRQVNQQVLVCLVDRGRYWVVVLVDQHAADERIRVERLISSLFIPSCSGKGKPIEYTLHPPVYELDDPIEVPLEVSVKKYTDQARVIRTLKQWGFHCSLGTRGSGTQQDTSSSSPLAPQGPRESEVELVRVEMCPVILKPRVERDRTCLHHVINHAFHPDSLPIQTPIRVTHPLQSVALMPYGLLDLINSRACRGAIMFGTEVCREESERILRELRDCVYAFQCAHGRPSLVPLCLVPQRS